LATDNKGENTTNYMSEVKNNVNPVMFTNMGWLVSSEETRLETDYF